MSKIQDIFSMDTSMTDGNEKLFPFINQNNKEELLDWLEKDIEEKFESSQARLEMARNFLYLYKGIHYRGMDYRRNENSDSYSGSYKPRMVVNFINEMVEAKVSQRSRFKPAYAVLPANADWEDEQSAQSAKMALDCKRQDLSFDNVFADGDKVNFICGDSFTMVDWDHELGQPIKTDGLKTKDEYMTGDIKIDVLTPFEFFPQLNKDKIEDVDDISTLKWMHTDELKALYPKLAGQIEDSAWEFWYDSSSSSYQMRKHYCLVITYWHKKTKFLPKGAKIIYTKGLVLEKNENPFADGGLPGYFDTDIDVPDNLRGIPFLQNIAQLQNYHNMLMVSAMRGNAVSSMPKWVYQKGSVHINKLTNDFGSIEFNGGVAPQLVTYAGVNPSIYDAMDRTEKYIEKGSTVYGTSRGEPPKGIKAAVALQFLDEQETQRESRGMAKRQNRMIAVARLVLSRMAQFYKPEDGRLLQIFGPDNSYLIDNFKSCEFWSQYNVHLQNQSSLPDSKTGKVAAILDINTATQADPMFSTADISNMLDLGNDRAFKDKASVSIKSAQSKVGMILSGKPAKEAEMYDDLLVEYPIILKGLQECAFKARPENVFLAFKEYVNTMEYLMFQKAQISPAFAMKLGQLSQYPSVFTPPPIMATPVGAPPPGEAPPNGPIDLSQAQQTNGQLQKDEAQQGL